MFNWFKRKKRAQQPQAQVALPASIQQTNDGHVATLVLQNDETIEFGPYPERRLAERALQKEATRRGITYRLS